MTVLSLVWGILALCGLFVGLIPCLGSLNWLNVPFSVLGLIVGIIALSKAPSDQKGGPVAGTIMCTIAALMGLLRLIMGGGIL